MKHTQPLKARVTVTIEPAQREALLAEAWRQTLEQRRSVSLSEVTREVLQRGLAMQSRDARPPDGVAA